MNLVEIFDGVPDFRNKSLISYDLSEMLVIALCGTLCGAEDFEEIEAYGIEKVDFLKQFLKLPNGIPSYDTFKWLQRRTWFFVTFGGNAFLLTC